MQNNGYLLFYFSSFYAKISKLIILLFGVTTLASGILILFFEDKKRRNTFLQILFILQLFNAFIIHNPFVEHLDSQPRELKHFMLSIMIGFSLFMLAGYRTN